MSAKENNIIGQLLKAIKETEKRQTAAYDSEATVRRIEGGTAWVHIPGGVDETPVKLTINATVGDTVQVRVSGGRAFLVGNASAPPTDDKTAERAIQNITKTSKVVEVVKTTAERTAKIAGNTNQYFWHTESGTDTGAHITEIPQEEFLQNPSGGNLLARSNGIAIRHGLTELAQFTSTSVNFLDSLGNTLASFGANGITIGQEIVVSSSGTLFNGDVTIRTGYIADFTLKRTNEVTYYPLYSDGGIILDSTGDMSANDSTHIVTIDDEEGDYVTHTLQYKFSAKSNNIEASYFIIQPYYAFGADDEDVDIAITIKYYNSSNTVTKTVTTTESYVASSALLTRLNLDRATAKNSSYIIVTLSLIDGSTCRAYCIYGVGTSLTYNTSEFMGRTDSSITSVYLGNDGISVNQTIGLATDGGITAYNIRLRGNDVEKKVRFVNNARENNKTYANDGVYPHDVYFYGSNAGSWVALGLWDARKAKPVWRYDDHNGLLRLEQNVLFITSKGRVNINDLFKCAGDSWKINVYCGGYVTTSGTEYRFSVATPYVVGTLSITAMTVYIRQNGSYIISNYPVPTGNISVDKYTNTARISFTTTAPSGVSNNSPVGVQAEITFKVA